MILRTKARAAAALVILATTLAPHARAAEHITLANGFELDCVRREVVGDKLRLFFGTTGENYMDVAAKAILRIEAIPDPVPAPAPKTTSAADTQQLDIPHLLARSGSLHHVDAELLAAVVHAESAGNTFAVSRTGARGLMQLMPATAATLGVADSFVADQNVEGGTKYLDLLLTRYHDNIALALAAYNAGPGAVDRYHGVPPFRETRAYVSRVITEFNRRKSAALLASAVGNGK